MRLFFILMFVGLLFFTSNLNDKASKQLFEKQRQQHAQKQEQLQQEREMGEQRKVEVIDFELKKPFTYPKRDHLEIEARRAPRKHNPFELRLNIWR